MAVVEDKVTALELELTALEEVAAKLVACKASGVELSSETCERIRAVTAKLDDVRGASADDDDEDDGELIPYANFSPVELRVWQQADAFFSAIDENNDGQISFDELEAHLSSLGFKAGAIDHIFDLLDVSGDGFICKGELRDSLRKYDDPALRMALGLGATDADDVFDAIAGGGGEISMAQLAEYLEMNSASGADVPASAATIFRTLDANSDGSISRDELRVGLEEYTEFRKVLGLDRR